MERAYRRPVSEDELGSKLALVTLAQKEGDKLEEGVRLALEAVLASPYFLFKVEADPADTNGIRPLNDFELASRLSYFLGPACRTRSYSGRPRQHKLAASRRPRGAGAAHAGRPQGAQPGGQLGSAMAAAAESRPHQARSGAFPTVDDELLDAMRRETSLFVEADHQGRPQRSRLHRRAVHVRQRPAGAPLRHSGVDGEEFQRVTLDGEQRGGLLTQGAILTVSSYPDAHSPPVRGKWVLENLLGTPPPPPPPTCRRWTKRKHLGTECRCASAWSSTAKTRAARPATC